MRAIVLLRGDSRGIASLFPLEHFPSTLSQNGSMGGLLGNHNSNSSIPSLTSLREDDKLSLFRLIPTFYSRQHCRRALPFIELPAKAVVYQLLIKNRNRFRLCLYARYDLFQMAVYNRPIFLS